MKALNSFIAFGLLLALVACSEAPLYEKVYSFDNKEWKQDQKLSFQVDIQDISKEYDFVFTIRTTTDYNFNNLWLFMKTIAPDGASGRVPYEVKIVNPDGSWIGNKTGSVVETELAFRRRKMPIKGTYTYIIEQGITESQVNEVLDVVFTVKDSEKQ